MSVSLDVCISLIVKANGADDDSLEAELNRVMEALVALADTKDSGISDPALSFDASTNTLTVELIATGTEFDRAAELADASIRSAVHAAGGGTAGWDQDNDASAFTTEKRSQRADLAEA